MAILDAALQRLPFVSHVAMLALAVYGPTFAPVVLATILLGIHLVLAANNLLTVWGQYCAVRGVADACKPRTFEETDVKHIIIVPAYKESLETLRTTLDVFASHYDTRHSYHVCLAMEEREQGAEKKALQLKIEYEDVFGDLVYTQHPGDIPGEAPGKSSNVNWAARQMAQRFPSSAYSSIVITVIDADTCLAQDYFQFVAERYTAATPEDRAHMMFVVPIIFDRNAHDVPALCRVTDTMWAQAGLSCTYPTSDIKIPTSVYGISCELAASVGFWDTGSQAIGEDMHMFIKAFLSTGGHLKVETIYSPASQLNVVGAHHGHGLSCLYLLWRSSLTRVKRLQGMEVRHEGTVRASTATPVGQSRHRLRSDPSRSRRLWSEPLRQSVPNGQHALPSIPSAPDARLALDLARSRSVLTSRPVARRTEIARMDIVLHRRRQPHSRRDRLCCHLDDAPL